MSTVKTIGTYPQGGTGLGTLGAANQVPKVNSGGTAIEWGDAFTYATPHSVENFTGSDTLTAAESGKMCTNVGAGGAIELTLPTAATGLTFSFTVGAAQYLRINFAAGDNGRYLTTTSATAGYFRNNAIGSFIQVQAIDATTWQVTSLDGTWSVDA